MRRVALIAGVLAMAAQPTAAQPQMAGAVGKPRVDAQLPVGTATVKVVRGAIDAPMTGLDVEMAGADGSSRTARTDSEGRATFPGLKASVEYKARMAITEGDTELSSESEPFSIPDAGGVRLLLSPVPWKGGGATSGMPDPRQMSGIARGEQNDPPGQITVRSVYGSMADNAEGAVIHLVGYGADGSIMVQSKPADAGGRAVFSGMPLSGRAAYYAVTILDRDQAVDRLRSNPISLPPQVGMRLMLAGHARDSDEPGVDDLEGLARQGAPANTAVATIYTSTMVNEVELVELVSDTVIATAATAQPRPTADTVVGAFRNPKPTPPLSDGSLSIAVVRPTPKGQQPIAGVPVAVRPVTEVEGAEPVAPGITDNTGLAMLTGLVPGQKYIASAMVHGQTIESNEIVMPDKGGMRVGVTATWEIDYQLEARFTGVDPDPAKVYAMRINSERGVFLSEPFQLASDRGAVASIVIFPERLVFQFHLNGIVEDRYMGFQGQFTLHNLSPIPFDPGKDGLLIPLPAGFVGAGLAEEAQSRVSIDTDRGFLWKGAIPPGSRQFTGGFSMHVVDGGFDFDMPVPYGAAQSNLIFLYEEGMEFNLPGGLKGKLKQNDFGRQFYVVNRIDIQPGTRMIMSVRGLPQYPAWRKYLQYGVGIVVLSLIGAVLVVIFRRRPEDEETVDESKSDWGSRKREQLYDALVDLEAQRDAGDVSDEEYERTRASLMAKLESNYEERAKRAS
jgi:hypothetical protein